MAVPLFAVVGLAMGSAAFGQITFLTGNHPQPGEENILLNNGTTGSTVQGTTNQSNIAVCFSSTTDTLSEPSNGQARIESTTGNANPVNNLSVSLCSGGPFTDLIFNPEITGSGKPPGGNAQVTVVWSGGTSVFNYNLGNGNNFATVFASGTDTITSVTIDATNGFSDLKQPRISGAGGGGGGGGVPEPGSAALLCAMCAGGLMRIRRRLR